MPDLWPPNSRDLNPVDLCLEYSAGENVRNSIREHRWTEVQTFRKWAKLDHEIIASAIRQWSRRLRACETADGGHLEQAFWTC